ncbi:MAG: aromatic-amino-acid transaminase [Clostridia bacterium]|jgi:aromatic-amino-acid transaminase|nr:aromatic-amino-acid transaminase [Clostridia bacterium]MDN5321668.1 aromatic-amino-acid transaminase [Clostridia bacterium]
MSKSLVASHSQGKHEPDKIFGVNAAANEKAKMVGKENIVNASIGAFLDANGELITLPTVEKTMYSLDFKDVAAYAPIAGLPDFIKAAIDVTFAEFKPDAYIDGVATPGGSGAIHHAIWNYTEVGDTYLTSDWYWGPYRTMAREMGRKIDTFVTFDENGNFNLKACLEKVQELARVQKNVLLIINSPAHNPTGFSLTFEEWEQLVAGLKELAEKDENNIILFVDIAYLDFTPPGSRKFFKLFSKLPANLLVIVAFSMSKGYTMYGYRTGCMIGISSDKEVIEEFFNVNQYSNRGTWSNGTRSGMRCLVELWKNPELMDQVKKEREEFRLSLEDRAKTFLDEAKKVGLEVCPYHSGFFITVPTTKSDEIAFKLQDDNIFIVPLARGLRIAICAIPSEKIAGMATKIKEAKDLLGG